MLPFHVVRYSAWGPWIAAVAIAFATLAVSRLARADGPFDGRWKQGPLREDYTVQQWLPGCGPPPVSASTGGGEVVQVSQDGDELVLAGGGRTFRTNQCYDPNPALQRDTHSRDPAQRSWRTRCVTPASDPRKETMNTLVVATSDTHLDMLETGRSEIMLADGRCIADVRRARAFDLTLRDPNAQQPAVALAPVTQQPSVSPVSPPQPAVARANLCDSPGDPVRLEVRPSRKLLRTGEQFAFHAAVLDANGCNTGTSASWSVAQGSAPSVSVDAQGRVTATTDSAEGSATIVVTAAGRTARVTVDVASPAHYSDLLAKSGLNGAGENDGATVAETGTIGGGDARAEDGTKTRRTWFLVIVGGLALVFGVLAVVLGRRTKKAAALEERADEAYEARVRKASERRAAKKAAHEAQQRAHEQSLKRAQEDARRDKARRDDEAARTMAAPPPADAQAPTMLSNAPPGTPAPSALAVTHVPSPTVMLCPTCRREYPMTGQYCSQDATKLVPFNGTQPAPAGMICPACKRGFPGGTRQCPFDREDLVPYAMHAAVPKPGTGTMLLTGKGKICPTCGGRFEGNAAFCGKDGTALVLIN